MPALQQIVATATAVRTLGSGHSFNRIADTTGDLVSVAGLPTVLELDSHRRQVRVSAGTRYGELGRYLQRNGFALHNTGSLPHISVAGASATGTHGSGVTNGNLATIVSAVDLVGAQGDLISLSRDHHGEQFNGMVLALGCLGVMTSLTLDVVPTFDVRQDVFEELTAAGLDEHFEEIMGSGYSVSVFTDWTSPGGSRSGASPRSARPSRRSNSSAVCPLRSTATPYPVCRARTRPPRWACPGPGTNGCRISGSSSPRAVVRRSRRNTFCHEVMRPLRGRPWRPSRPPSRRC